MTSQLETKEGVYQYMKDQNYKQGSKSWQDYEYAKVHFLGVDNYGSCCKWIAEYLRI
jgi:hypothetical protein